MDTKQILDEIGLSDGEQKVYLTLLKLGETTSGPIAEHSGVSASKVYQVADRLLKKGLVGESTKKGTKHFRAMHPRALLGYLKERQRQINQTATATKDVLPLLTEQFEETTQETEVQHYQGKDALRNALYGMIDELKKGEEYHVIGANIGIVEEANLLPFFDEYHAEREQRGIKAKILFQTKKPVGEDYGHGVHIKYLPSEFDNPLQINVFNDKTTLIIMGTHPIIFTITNQEVARSFNQYFKSMWNKAEKP